MYENIGSLGFYCQHTRMQSILYNWACAIIALLSPMLTLTYVWQLKEWRLDRLYIHFIETKNIQPLFHYKRNAIVVFGLLSIIIAPQIITELCLIALASLSLLQVILKKQPLPVWTQKAQLFIGITIALNIIVLAISQSIWPHNLAVPLGLISLQPLCLAVSWLLLYPLDYFLKKRILNKAAALRRTLTCTVIGITGSVGKTTTKELIKALLDPADTWVTPEHVNSELGLANWLIHKMQASSQRPHIMVLEMGAYKKGEIALMCSIFKPSIGVITLIGDQHIALFGSQQSLLEAKSELLASLPASGHAVINGDDAKTLQTLQFTTACIHTVGVVSTNTYQALQVTENQTGLQFKVDAHIYQTNFNGLHNVSNILLAMQVAQLVGVPIGAIQKRLAATLPPSKTFTVYTKHSCTILDDTHNSSSSSMLSAIAWAKDRPEAYKTLLCSGLIEQGHNRPAIHKKIGSACNGIFEQVICTNKIAAEELQQGFSGTVQTWHQKIATVPAGSLLVCTGRMPVAHINTLLPQN